MKKKFLAWIMVFVILLQWISPTITISNATSLTGETSILSTEDSSEKESSTEIIDSTREDESSSEDSNIPEETTSENLEDKKKIEDRAAGEDRASEEDEEEKPVLNMSFDNGGFDSSWDSGWYDEISEEYTEPAFEIEFPPFTVGEYDESGRLEIKEDSITLDEETQKPLIKWYYTVDVDAKDTTNIDYLHRYFTATKDSGLGEPIIKKISLVQNGVTSEISLTEFVAGNIVKSDNDDLMKSVAHKPTTIKEGSYQYIYEVETPVLENRDYYVLDVNSLIKVNLIKGMEINNNGVLETVEEDGVVIKNNTIRHPVKAKEDGILSKFNEDTPLVASGFYGNLVTGGKYTSKNEIQWVKSQVNRQNKKGQFSFDLSVDKSQEVKKRTLYIYEPSGEENKAYKLKDSLDITDYESYDLELEPSEIAQVVIETEVVNLGEDHRTSERNALESFYKDLIIEKEWVDERISGNVYLADMNPADILIEAEFPNGEKLETSPDEDGDWEIKYSKTISLKENDKVLVRVRDKTGQKEVSKDFEVYVAEENHLGQPMVEYFHSDDDTIVGSGAAQAKVEVTFPDGKKQEVLVDKNGLWTVENLYKGKYKDTDSISVLQKDQANSNLEKSKPTIKYVLPLQTQAGATKISRMDSPSVYELSARKDLDFEIKVDGKTKTKVHMPKEETEVSEALVEKFEISDDSIKRIGYEVTETSPKGYRQVGYSVDLENLKYSFSNKLEEVFVRKNERPEVGTCSNYGITSINDMNFDAVRYERRGDSNDYWGSNGSVSGFIKGTFRIPKHTTLGDYITLTLPREIYWKQTIDPNQSHGSITANGKEIGYIYLVSEQEIEFRFNENAYSETDIEGDFLIGTIFDNKQFKPDNQHQNGEQYIGSINEGFAKKYNNGKDDPNNELKNNNNLSYDNEKNQRYGWGINIRNEYFYSPEDELIEKNPDGTYKADLYDHFPQKELDFISSFNKQGEEACERELTAFGRAHLYYDKFTQRQAYVKKSVSKEVGDILTWTATLNTGGIHPDAGIRGKSKLQKDYIFREYLNNTIELEHGNINESLTKDIEIYVGEPTGSYGFITSGSKKPVKIYPVKEDPQNRYPGVIVKGINIEYGNNGSFSNPGYQWGLREGPYKEYLSTDRVNVTMNGLDNQVVILVMRTRKLDHGPKPELFYNNIITNNTDSDAGIGGLGDNPWSEAQVEESYSTVPAKASGYYTETFDFQVRKVTKNPDGETTTIENNPAIFNLKGGDKDKIYAQQASTEKTGIAKFTGLLPNTIYELSESVAPDGYQKTGKTFKIRVDEKGNFFLIEDGKEIPITAKIKDIDDPTSATTIFSLDVENVLDRGLVIKKTAENGIKLNGAVFNLKSNDGKYDISLGEDKDVSEFRFYDLIEGEYLLTEVKAPKGYEKIDPIKIKVEKSTDGNLVIYKEEKDKGYVAIGEKDKEDFLIKVEDKKENALEFLKVDKANKPINETYKPEDFRFSLYKEDENGEEMEISQFRKAKLKKARYLDGKEVEEKTLDETSKLSYKNLEDGNYYLFETKAADGLILSKYPMVGFSITDGIPNLPTSAPTKLVNYPLGKFIIKKVDEEEKPLANAKFILYRQMENNDGKDPILPVNGIYPYKVTSETLDGDKIKELKVENDGSISTDSSGKIKFENVNEGTYYLKEVKSPDGYKENDLLYKIVVNYDGTTIVTEEIETNKEEIEEENPSPAENPSEEAGSGEDREASDNPSLDERVAQSFTINDKVTNYGTTVTHTSSQVGSQESTTFDMSFKATGLQSEPSQRHLVIVLPMMVYENQQIDSTNNRMQVGAKEEKYQITTSTQFTGLHGQQWHLDTLKNYVFNQLGDLPSDMKVSVIGVNGGGYDRQSSLVNFVNDSLNMWDTRNTRISSPQPGAYTTLGEIIPHIEKTMSNWNNWVKDNQAYRWLTQEFSDVTDYLTYNTKDDKEVTVVQLFGSGLATDWSPISEHLMMSQFDNPDEPTYYDYQGSRAYYDWINAENSNQKRSTYFLTGWTYQYSNANNPGNRVDMSQPSFSGKFVQNGNYVTLADDPNSLAGGYDGKLLEFIRAGTEQQADLRIKLKPYIKFEGFIGDSLNDNVTYDKETHSIIAKQGEAYRNQDYDFKYRISIDENYDGLEYNKTIPVFEQAPTFTPRISNNRAVIELEDDLNQGINIEGIDIGVKRDWNDVLENERVSTLISLLANNTVVDSISFMGTSPDEIQRFKTVAAYDSNGEKINYKIQETGLPELLESKISDIDSSNVFKIDTSYRTVTFKFNKRWENTPDKDKPESISVSLLAQVQGENGLVDLSYDDVHMNKEDGETETKVLNKDNKWQGEFKNLKYSIDGKKIIYSVKEEETLSNTYNFETVVNVKEDVASIINRKIDTMTVVNYKDELATLLIRKSDFDRENERLLAKFALYKLVDGKEELVINFDTSESGSFKGEKGHEDVMGVSTLGEVKLENLETGSYVLKETKAPEGYAILPVGINLNISNLSTTIENQDQVSNMVESLLNEDGLAVINIKNKISQYPGTGSFGSLPFVMVGLFLMALALINLKKKETFEDFEMID